MNKAVKSFILLFALLYYGFVANLNIVVASNNKIQNLLQNKHGTISFAKVSADYYLQTTEAELFTKTAPSQQSNTGQNPFSKLFVLVKLWNQKLQTNFSQYSFYSKKLLVTFCKTDIFFPFHHFW